MKNYLFVVLIFLLVISFACADLIPVDSHFVDKCLTINNINDFSDYVIIGAITGPMVGDLSEAEIVELEQDVCISKGYKFNKIRVFAVERDYFEEMDSNIDLKSDKVYAANIETEPYAGYVSNSNPLSKVTQVLTIKEVTNDGLILEVFSEHDENNHPVSPASFLTTIFCFFSSLFGMSC